MPDGGEAAGGPMPTWTAARSLLVVHVAVWQSGHAPCAHPVKDDREVALPLIGLGGDADGVVGGDRAGKYERNVTPVDVGARDPGLARLVQGAGAALLLPSALVLATSAASDERSGHRLVGWWAAAGGVGMAAGPLLGGILVALSDWRAVFGVNVIVGIPAIAWTLRSMPPIASRARRLDLAGMTTATALIGGLVFALIQGPALDWLNWADLAAIGVAAAGAIGFVCVERSVKAPLLPVGVYSDRVFAATAIQGDLFNFTFYGLLFAMSLMLQDGRGLSALVAGVLFLPLTGLISVGTLRAAPLSQRLGRPNLIGISQAILTVTLVGVAWAASASSLWPLMIALLPAGLFSGLLVPAMTSQSIAAVEPALHGAASAAFNTSRQVGEAIGIATFGPLLGTSHNLAWRGRPWGRGISACPGRRSGRGSAVPGASLRWCPRRGRMKSRTSSRVTSRR